MRRPAMPMMSRRWHLTTTTHQMTAIPDVLADDSWTRLGSDRCERCDERREQDEQYEFAHGSIL
jgi:hypothetical protein